MKVKEKKEKWGAMKCEREGRGEIKLKENDARKREKKRK